MIDARAGARGTRWGGTKEGLGERQLTINHWIENMGYWPLAPELEK